MKLKGLKRGTTFLIGTFENLVYNLTLKVKEALGFEIQ
jgi:hypothetical protein